ncbi:hypothetical protein QFZ27_000172 [Inquilinus ginsengisoli]|uniref:hypothetical protein n=1 Tax=Inquilinus ginsengisoli TaxID=363840 RepID=UPI003D217AD7
MTLPLKWSRPFHVLMATKPTAAPVVGTGTVSRKVPLPGGVTMNLTATAEALADRTHGSGSRFSWEFDSRPMPGPETEDGAFYDAWEAALGEAADAALQAAR